jgi:hypothetical protein
MKFTILIEAFLLYITMHLVFSLPERKAQVSFSDRPLSVVLLSIRLAVCPSVCL